MILYKQFFTQASSYCLILHFNFKVEIKCTSLSSWRLCPLWWFTSMNNVTAVRLCDRWRWSCVFNAWHIKRRIKMRHRQLKIDILEIDIEDQFRLLEKKCSWYCAHRNGHGVFWLTVIHIQILKGKQNMALIYPKSNVECKVSVFDGQINCQNSNAALRMNLGFECKNRS